jgi:preprotein translocase subunit SecF
VDKPRKVALQVGFLLICLVVAIAFRGYFSPGVVINLLSMSSYC